MSKLRARLRDAARSGVYRVRRTDAIDDAVRGTKLNVGRVDLDGAATKEAMLERIAKALGFPDWFGGNWDALEDCLIDLSWREAEGHVLLFSGLRPSDDLGVLIDVLASSAEFWAARGRPFFAVLVDPQRALGLAELHREK
jgi:hypothetical protein